MRLHTEADRQRWQQMVGKAITKTSRKPFKSGKKIGVATAIVQHKYTPHSAFMMDDGSCVECFRCELAVACELDWEHESAELDWHIVQCKVFV